MKIIVRHALYIEDEGRISPVGGRLFRGETGGMWPRECVDADGSYRFHFDDATSAQRAAIVLRKYIEKNET